MSNRRFTTSVFQHEILQGTLLRSLREGSALLSTPHNSVLMDDMPTSSYKQMLADATFKGLPNELTRMILSYLTFDELSQIRPVCRALNREASNLLNRGYEKFTTVLERDRAIIKKALPRRESERRNHRFSKLADVYSAMDTRKALLDMTYKKFIDEEAICFIPGKVLDEALNVLKIMERCRLADGNAQLDASGILKDIRDLSSMAIEHFEEFIEPGIKETLAKRPRFNQFKSITPNHSSSSLNFSISSPTTSCAEQDELRKLLEKQQTRFDNLQTGFEMLLDFCGELSTKYSVPLDIASIRSHVNGSKTAKEESVTNKKSQKTHTKKRLFDEGKEDKPGSSEDVVKEPIKKAKR